MRLLIVEDEKQMCDTVARSLYAAGYEVDTCYDGAEALECILAENYDLIVLDLVRFGAFAQILERIFGDLDHPHTARVEGLPGQEGLSQDQDARHAAHAQDRPRSHGVHVLPGHQARRQRRDRA